MEQDDTQTLDALLAAVRACTRCARDLPCAPRPVVRAASTARLLIVGQAPGLRVHETGIPWNDPSGDRLRAWMAVDKDTFYDETRIAIIPAGFCYPGRNNRGGDRPPRQECAPIWHMPLVRRLPAVALILLAGRYAQRIHLGDRIPPTLTETVRAWRSYGPRYFPMPHPSFRNTLWLRRNPWFENEALPALRRRIRKVLSS